MTDFTTMTDDELADDVKAMFTELHARHAAMPTGPLKTRTGRQLRIAHHAFDQIKELLRDDEVIQPFSGGSDKGDGEP